MPDKFEYKFHVLTEIATLLELHSKKELTMFVHYAFLCSFHCFIACIHFFLLFFFFFLLFSSFSVLLLLYNVLYASSPPLPPSHTGARWDSSAGVLVEAMLKELTSAMPVLYIRAVPADQLELKNTYECPVYRNKLRGPTFIWSFHLRTRHPPTKWTLAGAALLLSEWRFSPHPITQRDGISLKQYINTPTSHLAQIRSCEAKAHTPPVSTKHSPQCMWIVFINL